MHAYNHGTIVNWLERTAENLDTLQHEMPHIPPLQLVPFASKKRIDRDAIDREFNDKGKAGTAQADTGNNDAERIVEQHDDADIGGRGRSADFRRTQDITEGRANTSIRETAGGLEGREVRPGLNGGTGGHLPTGG